MKKFCYPHNSSIKSPKSDTSSLGSLKFPSREVLPFYNLEAISCDWGFLLAEAITYAPWSSEASLFVDGAIALSEGGEA